MAKPPADDLPQHALFAASFAESIAREYACSGGNIRDLFVALAGLVSARDKQVGADCLKALDESLSSRASGQNTSPSA